MKVTEVDGSIDEQNGLKCTVGDKSLGLLSTTIDKALGGMLKDEETQLKCSPEYAEGANIDLTLVQVTRKTISDKTVTEKAESENVVAESVSDQQVLTEKAVVKKAARGEDDYREAYCRKCCSRGRHIPTGETHGHITTWCRCECTARGSGSSPRANVGDR